MPLALSERAMPKSMIRAFPSRSIMMLRLEVPVDDAQPVGFLQALADLRAIDTAVAIASLPDFRIIALRSSPETYSIVM